MTEDVALEIKKKIFLGTVPVRAEVDGMDIPLCFNVPRCSSLGSFFWAKIKHELGQNCEDFHLTVNGTDEVQPNIPAGIIYDSYFPPKSGFKPLSVQVHTSGFKGSVIRCPNEIVASHYFCHAFKESLFLKEGNLVFLQQNIGVHKRIEDALLNADFETFKTMNELFTKESLSWNFWPVKVYRKGQKMLQAFLNVEGAEQTLADVLKTKEIEAEKVNVHGIEINTSTKMQEIMPLLSYPDGFLYIVV